MNGSLGEIVQIQHNFLICTTFWRIYVFFCDSETVQSEFALTNTSLLCDIAVSCHFKCIFLGIWTTLFDMSNTREWQYYSMVGKKRLWRSSKRPESDYYCAQGAAGGEHLTIRLTITGQFIHNAQQWGSKTFSGDGFTVTICSRYYFCRLDGSYSVG